MRGTGPTALDWRPTGNRMSGGPTIVELLEGVRVRVNAKLDSADHFKWRYADLTADNGLDREAAHTRPRRAAVRGRGEPPVGSG